MRWFASICQRRSGVLGWGQWVCLFQGRNIIYMYRGLTDQEPSVRRELPGRVNGLQLCRFTLRDGAWLSRVPPCQEAVPATETRQMRLFLKDVQLCICSWPSSVFNRLLALPRSFLFRRCHSRIGQWDESTTSAAVISQAFPPVFVPPLQDQAFKWHESLKDWDSVRREQGSSGEVEAEALVHGRQRHINPFYMGSVDSDDLRPKLYADFLVSPHRVNIIYYSLLSRIAL